MTVQTGTTSRPALSRWWPFPQRKESPVDGDVVALRFDEEAVAEDLARWCDGQVVMAEGVDGTITTTIYVPTARGPRPALFGDWIVLTPDGQFAPCSPAKFAARFEPQA